MKAVSTSPLWTIFRYSSEISPNRTVLSHETASVVRKVVHPLARCVRSVEIRTKRISLSLSGNKGVWIWSRRLGKFIDLERPDNKKLNEEHVNWILREKKKGILTNAQMGAEALVQVRAQVQAA